MRFSSARSCRARAIPKRQRALSRTLLGLAVLAKVKFCGMTRPDDAALAAEIGASYIGVVFADGPRRVSPAQGRKILDAAGTGVCLLYTSDAADDLLCVDLGGRRI